MSHEVNDTTFQRLAAARPSYKWRVQSATQYSATCVAYIDARQVMNLLDEVVGPANWQDHYREVSGNVYCDLSIKVGGEWVTKSDCGSESNIEAEKGQASDAFKRAAVKWGIGRFLYELPMVKIKEVIDTGKGKFVPAHNGQRIWDISDHIRKMGLDRSGQQQAQKPATSAAKPDPIQPLKRPDQTTLNDIARIAKLINLTGEELQQWLKDTHETTYQKMDADVAKLVLTDLQDLAADMPADSRALGGVA